MSIESLKNILSGSESFYNKNNYLTSTKSDFSQTKPLAASYTYNTENKTSRIAKQVFSVIVFPVGLYKLLHVCAGKIIVPASTPSLFAKNYASSNRSEIVLNKEWKYKRITVEVDGYKIDAMIVGKATTLNNGRWVLGSLGNAGFYEATLSQNTSFTQILSEIQGNGILFNYPGVGTSSGLPNRQALAKAYRAMLTLLEDDQRGIGAKEIIGYGHSIGGGVQAEAIKKHELKNHIKYVFVKDRTFSSLSATASSLYTKALGFLVKILGWNINSVNSSINLKAPEIIMQTANVTQAQILESKESVKGDGIIADKVSLAKTLLNNTNCPTQNKVFIGIPENHDDVLENTTFLTSKIKKIIKK